MVKPCHSYNFDKVNSINPFYPISILYYAFPSTCSLGNGYGCPQIPLERGQGKYKKVSLNKLGNNEVSETSWRVGYKRPNTGE